MYDFNEDSGKLLVKRADGLQFDLELRKPLTVIWGNSATGKTLLCKLIEESNVAITNPKIQIINYKDMGRVERLNIIYTETIPLFIIDNADLVLKNNPGLFDYISRVEYRNQFLVFSRCLEFCMTPNYFGTFYVDDDSVIKIKYVASEASWYV